jgi:hypothetical protein
MEGFTDISEGSHLFVTLSAALLSSPNFEGIVLSPGEVIHLPNTDLLKKGLTLQQLAKCAIILNSALDRTSEAS